MAPRLWLLSLLFFGALLMPTRARSTPSPAPPGPQRVQESPPDQFVPTSDSRAVAPKDLNSPRTFPAIHTLAEWKRRRSFIREQVLISCGLWPLPPRTPLHARIFGRVERDGYSVEKVYFESYPGFYVTGNLYRPASSPHTRRVPPYPGVLVAHGHWAEGRMADGPEGSIPARAITFAREGCVAFTYDMVGYNDSRQIPHTFAGDREHWLWGVSLMGLQTWNSLRAVDFLRGLPDVDRSRLAITGESGGGTQTFMLGAIDDRLAAVGPCVMVSHTMQGGCLCENAPGLRVEISNMEIAAAAAPRPQIMVAAAGDWTSSMETVEGPAVESIYRLYGAQDRLAYPIFNFGHNINKTSREAVYGFFGKWLLGRPSTAPEQEPPYRMEPVNELRIFPDGTPLPKNACTPESLTATLKAAAITNLNHSKPRSTGAIRSFRRVYLPAWQHTMQAEIPAVVRFRGDPTGAPGTAQRGFLGRPGRGDSIPVALFRPDPAVARNDGVVLADPRGIAGLLDGSGAPGPLVRRLLNSGLTVLLLDAFLTGSRQNPAAETARKPFDNYFSTYNRTDLQERVQDLLTTTSFLKRQTRRVTLVGRGRAGLWALLAAEGADALAADCDELNLENDKALLADDLFVPGLRRMGDFKTGAALAAPRPLLLHHTGSRFEPVSWITDLYKSLGAPAALKVRRDRLDDTGLAAWIASEASAAP